MTFSYEADAEGYMIFWNGKPLGGAGIIGKYRGRKRKAQIAEYAKQAQACIRGLESGRGRKDMREVLEEIKAEEEKPCWY
jgi:hypothetical protein